jgi:hypothetical protein
VPVEAVFIVAILVAALNAVGVICLLAGELPSTPRPSSNAPWWIARSTPLTAH